SRTREAGSSSGSLSDAWIRLRRSRGGRSSASTCNSRGCVGRAGGGRAGAGRRRPVFGGKVRSFDATKAKAVPGVRDVVQVPTGVAVVADHFWAAKLGRGALTGGGGP